MCAVEAGMQFPAIAAHAGGSDDVINPVILVADAAPPAGEGSGTFGASLAQWSAGGWTAS